MSRITCESLVKCNFPNTDCRRFRFTSRIDLASLDALSEHVVERLDEDPGYWEATTTTW